MFATGLEPRKKSNNFQIARDWTSGPVDAFVTSEIKRTVNFLLAISKGLPVLSSDAITGIKDGPVNVMDRSLWLVDRVSEKKWGMKVEESVHKARVRKVLDGLTLWTHGKFPISSEEIKSLVVAMGGTWLSRAPAEVVGDMICISADTDGRKNARVVDLDWLLKVAITQEREHP